MRTTIDLPDELFRIAKAHAAMEGVSLKVLIEEALKHLLNAPRKNQTSRVTESEASLYPSPPKSSLNRASAGAWARQFAGVAKPAAEESIDDARMAHYRDKYGVK